VPVVGKRRAAFIVLLFCFCLPVFTSGVAFASSGNWVEVTSFSQGRPWFGNTSSFRCDHVEWRIRWEYVIDESMLTAFLFEIRLQDTDEIIGDYSNSGKLNITEGIYNITDYEGEFYLFIGTNAKSYSIIVEQNLESIPEFALWTPTLVALAVLTVAVTIYKRRLRKIRNKKRMSCKHELLERK